MIEPTKEQLKKEADEALVIAAIEAMPDDDKQVAYKLHTLIKDNAPMLSARTWYGMPAYTDGSKIICFFRSKKKFGERYMTLGFNDIAKLDDGNMWPITYALTQLSSLEEERIAALIQKATM